MWPGVRNSSLNLVQYNKYFIDRSSEDTKISQNIAPCLTTPTPQEVYWPGRTDTSCCGKVLTCSFLPYPPLRPWPVSYQIHTAPSPASLTLTDWAPGSWSPCWIPSMKGTGRRTEFSRKCERESISSPSPSTLASISCRSCVSPVAAAALRWALPSSSF